MAVMRGRIDIQEQESLAVGSYLSLKSVQMANEVGFMCNHEQ